MRNRPGDRDPHVDLVEVQRGAHGRIDSAADAPGHATRADARGKRFSASELRHADAELACISRTGDPTPRATRRNDAGRSCACDERASPRRAASRQTVYPQSTDLPRDAFGPAFWSQVERAKARARARGWIDVGEFRSFREQTSSPIRLEMERRRAEGARVMFFVTADGHAFVKAFASARRPPEADLTFNGVVLSPRAAASALELTSRDGAARGSAVPGLTVPVPPALPSIIGGEDNLVPVQPRSLMANYPYRWIGKIMVVQRFEAAGWQTDQGSGALIGPCHVLTAGHVAYDRLSGYWIHVNPPSIASFRPGQYADGDQPHGAGRMIVGAWAAWGWVMEPFDLVADEHDVGWLLLFDEARTAALGWFPGLCPPLSG